MPWELVVLGVFGCSLFLVLYNYRDMRDPITLFLFVVLWLRILIPFLHQYTMAPIAAGLSGAAITTLAIIGSGLLLTPIRYYFLPHLIPFYIIFVFLMLSALVNGLFLGLVNDLSRWMFFMIVALLSVRAMERHGIQKILSFYAIILLPALVLQLLGVPMGIHIVESDDGMISYIGGHYIASAFWKLLFGLICVAALLRTRRDLIPMALLLVCMVGIYLSAGRTALATALPVLGMVGLSVLGQGKMPLFRVVLIMVGGLTVVPLVWLALNAPPERYAVVFDFVANLDLAFANPAEFTEFESRLGTGRILIWAKLLYEWRSGTEVQYLFGFGPDTTVLAPHNEFVGFLYRTGILGLFAFLLMLAWQLVLIARVPDRWVAVRLLGCMVGFMIGCFTSHQVWAIEGLLILAVICATTWVALDEKGLGRVGGPAAATAPGSGTTAKLAARWTKIKMGARTSPAA